MYGPGLKRARSDLMNGVLWPTGVGQSSPTSRQGPELTTRGAETAPEPTNFITFLPCGVPVACAFMAPTHLEPDPNRSRTGPSAPENYRSLERLRV